MNNIDDINPTPQLYQKIKIIIQLLKIEIQIADHFLLGSLCESLFKVQISLKHDFINEVITPRFASPHHFKRQAMSFNNTCQMRMT